VKQTKQHKCALGSLFYQFLKLAKIKIFLPAIVFIYLILYIDLLDIFVVPETRLFINFVPASVSLKPKHHQSIH